MQGSGRQVDSVWPVLRQQTGQLSRFGELPLGFINGRIDKRLLVVLTVFPYLFAVGEAQEGVCSLLTFPPRNFGERTS